MAIFGRVGPLWVVLASGQKLLCGRKRPALEQMLA